MARDITIQDPQRLLKNMVIIRNILAKHDIPCWLHYGTCLGAIREHNFIAHDDDADMGIYGKDYEKFMSLLPELEEAGLINVPESDWNGRLIQFINKPESGQDTHRGGAEQVDVFYETEIRILRIFKRWNLGGRISVPYRFFKTLDTTTFLGETFYIPHDAANLMKLLYGKTWQTPIANVPSKNGITYQLKKIFRNPGKIFFYIKRKIGKVTEIRTTVKKADNDTFQK